MNKKTRESMVLDSIAGDNIIRSAHVIILGRRRSNLVTVMNGQTPSYRRVLSPTVLPPGIVYIITDGADGMKLGRHYTISVRQLSSQEEVTNRLGKHIGKIPYHKAFQLYARSVRERRNNTPQMKRPVAKPYR